MKPLMILSILSMLLLGGVCALEADDPPKTVRTMAAPNAAGIYWHAFAAFPITTNEEKKLIRESKPSLAAQLPEELAHLVARYERAIHELHRARTVLPCDWQLDMAAGPGLILPHVDKSYELSRVALLRARQQFAEGKIDAALGDVLAVFKLARDCGSTPLVITLIVGATIEHHATEVLTAHLPNLNKEQIQMLKLAIAELPPTINLATAIKIEASVCCDWLEREINTEFAKRNDPNAGGEILYAITEPLNYVGGSEPTDEEAAELKRKADLVKSLTIADVRKSLKRMRSEYAEFQQIAELSFIQREKPLKSLCEPLSNASKMQTRDDAMRYLSVCMLPNWKTIIPREESWQTRRKLLEQALYIQLEGGDIVREIDGKKVEYLKTATGFELRCMVHGKPETLTIGFK